YPPGSPARCPWGLPPGNRRFVISRGLSSLRRHTAPPAPHARRRLHVKQDPTTPQNSPEARRLPPTPSAGPPHPRCQSAPEAPSRTPAWSPRDRPPSTASTPSNGPYLHERPPSVPQKPSPKDRNPG